MLSYFSAIPSGHRGVGHGVFQAVGTPKRFLWPALGILSRFGILAPVWQHDVPFTVVNTPGVDGAGRPLVRATRTFHFGSGDFEMVDVIAAQAGTLIDHLGRFRLVSADLIGSIEDGALTMASTRVRIRLGGRRITVPRVVAPVVELTERFDDTSGLQCVAVSLTMPLLGRVYEYSGSFDYHIGDVPPAEVPLVEPLSEARTASPTDTDKDQK